MQRRDGLGRQGAHFGEPVGVFGLTGQIAPLMGIAGEVVQLLTAVEVVQVAPALGAEGVVLRAVEVGEGRVRPFGLGIAQQRHQAALGDAGLGGQSAQVGEGAEQVDEADRAITDAARCGALRQSGRAFGHPHHQRHAGAGPPTGELLPVLFLAQMPAVVAPEHDDGVVAMRALLQRVEHAAEHGIGEMDGGEVGLDGFFPLPLRLDVLEVAVARDASALGGQVIDIVRLVAGRQLDALEREGLKVLLRHEPGLVGSVNAAGEEEGLLMLAQELLTNPLRHGPVAAILLIADRERGPVGLDILPVAGTRQADRPVPRREGAWQGSVSRLVGEVLVPARRIDDIVQHLARARTPVAMPRKITRQQLRLRQHLAQLLLVAVQPRAMRRQAAEDRAARGIARGRRAVGVAKQHPAGGQAVEVRRQRLRMPAEAADPVAQIVERDEENVGPALRRQCMAAKERRDRKKCQERFHQPDSGLSSPRRLGKIVGARWANGHKERSGAAVLAAIVSSR